MGAAPGRSEIAELEPAVKQAPPPPLYQVVLINDDYTPMDFVVDLLKSVFGFDEIQANTIMLEVHHRGRGVCGVFGHDVARAKEDQVMRMAQEARHPLMVVVEKAP